jgi:hypothetical protein
VLALRSDSHSRASCPGCARSESIVNLGVLEIKFHDEHARFHFKKSYSFICFKDEHMGYVHEVKADELLNEVLELGHFDVSPTVVPLGLLLS